MRLIVLASALAACYVPVTSFTSTQDGSSTDTGSSDDGSGSRVFVTCSELAASSSPPFFCDGFEMGIAAQWTTQFATSGTASLMQAASPAIAGAFSLHAHTDQANGTNAQAYVTKFFNLLPNVMFVRAFVFYQGSSSPTITPDLLTVYEDTNMTGIRVYVINGKITVTNATALQSHPSTVSLPVGKWTCLELELTTAASQGFQLWLDDGPVLTQAEQVQPSNALNTVLVGLNATVNTTQPLTDVYVDDVAVSATRIGCTR